MKILVPVDGSPSSLRAVKFAIDQAKARAGSSLVLVNVQNLAMLGPGFGIGILPPSLIEQEEERAATEALQDAVNACRSASVAFATRSERGGIAAMLDRVAREEHVEQIVMGTRGLGGVGELLLGSVATQVVHLADVPVTLVK